MSSSKAPPKVFISYSHDSPEHMERVLEFADRLVAEGIDVILDRYAGVPPEGWPLWMARQVRAADFVLVVCTKTYLDRVEGREMPGAGRGVRWESLLVYGEIYNRDSNNPKFIPVLMDQEQAENIPAPLASTSRYLITDAKQYEDLYRRLTSQPPVEKPVMGRLKSLPRRQSQTLDFEASPESVPQKKPWLVPHERNPVFTGREEILKDLRDDLVKNGRQALSGLGGIGKTQIAVEYAFRHREDYRAVLWTFADSEQAISSGFSQMAQALGLAEYDSKQQGAVTAAVQRWLEQNDGWLLVFDNADAPAVVKRFLPEQGRGHILLTSRAHVFHVLNIIQAREVDVLSPVDSRQFLLKRTGQNETAAVNDLAKELGYLPLALEQAAAYIVENGSSFQDYLKSFRRRRLELLKQQGPVMGTPKEQQKTTVATAWLLNFAEVEKSPASADLLRLSAFLAPDIVPLELLEKGAGEMGAVPAALTLASDDPLALDGLLRPLTLYSLIRRNPDTRSFSIHPLVQEVMRNEMDQRTRISWIERTIRVVNVAFPEVKFELWPDCERLLSHALACVGLIDSFQSECEAAGALLRKAGNYLNERAQYSQAEPLLERSVAIYEKAPGDEQLSLAGSLHALAELYLHQAKYKEAELLCLRALKIREKLLGSQHEDTAGILDILARVNQQQGKYKEAEPLFQRALEIRRRVLGLEHSDTATSLSNLAALHEAEGKYAEAEPLYRRALEIKENALGMEHPDTATSLNNFAGLLYRQGKYAEAEPLYRRALAISERALGLEHPDTAISLNNLAKHLYSRGEFAEAEPLYRRALGIREKALGPWHPDTATSLSNLALLLDSQEKYGEAEPLYRRALTILEKSLPGHPGTIAVATNLAKCCRAQGRDAEAELLPRPTQSLKPGNLAHEQGRSDAIETTFLSYSREDSEFVLRLAKDLDSAGAKIWVDQLKIEPGEFWDAKVEGALLASSRQLIILSPAAVNSRNVKDEIQTGLEEGKQIIPVLYQDCKIPLGLRRLQRVDFRPGYDGGLRALFKVLGLKRSEE